MSNRLIAHFDKAKQENLKSLIMFLTAGFPNLEISEKLIQTLDESGADVLELGVPFSDPIADGPTIQAASNVALANGITLEKILELVRRVRQFSQIPIVLFGAYNPFLHYGLDKLVKKAVEVGVDGFLCPEIPLEESEEFRTICVGAGLPLVYLAAPSTPPDRMKEIAVKSSGFLYFISLKGVTGTSIQVDDVLREKVRQLREIADPLPVGVGFGIRTPEEVGAVAKLSDAVIVGSALIRVVDQNQDSPDLLEKVGEYVRSLKAAL
jgi:tryptophan synthase alpha chain